MRKPQIQAEAMKKLIEQITTGRTEATWAFISPGVRVDLIKTGEKEITIKQKT